MPHDPEPQFTKLVRTDAARVACAQGTFEQLSTERVWVSGPLQTPPIQRVHED